MLYDNRGVLSSMSSKKKKTIKKISFLVVVFAIITFVSTSILNLATKKNIEYVLESKSYSYLPLEAKNYIKDIYDESGEIVLTEKNKEENKPYLNPEYIEYLELSEEEREKVFEMDIEISKLQSARERGQLTKEMIEFDKAFEELKKLEM